MEPILGRTGRGHSIKLNIPLITKLRSEGKTTKEISEITGIRVRTVNSISCAAGLPGRKTAMNRMTDGMRARAVQMVETGYPVRYVARKLNVSRYALYGYFNTIGLDTPGLDRKVEVRIPPVVHDKLQALAGHRPVENYVRDLLFEHVA